MFPQERYVQILTPGTDRSVGGHLSQQPQETHTAGRRERRGEQRLLKGKGLGAFEGQERPQVRQQLYVPGEQRVGGWEGVMGGKSGVQQDRPVKGFECHTNGFRVDQLQPETRSGLPLVIVNKVLLEQKHTHSFTHGVLFGYDGRVG